MAITTIIFGGAVLCVIVSLICGVGFWFQDRRRTDNDRIWWAAVSLIFAVALGLIGFVVAQL